MSSRHPLAKHAYAHDRGVLSRVLAVVLAAVAAIAVAGVGVAAFIANDIGTSFTENAVTLTDEPIAAPSIGEYPGAFSVLVVGTDECSPELVDVVGSERCLDPEANGKLNDVNILVHVSAAPRRMTVVQFPRDMLIDMPECTREDGSTRPASYGALNSIYPDGGLNCVVDAISDLSGLPIEFAAKVSFANVVAITDAIGGVVVCVAGDGIHDPHTGLNLDPGEHEVSGGEALQFLRTRYGVGDGSDLARGGNQRQYLTRLLEKLRSDQVLGDAAALLRLATVASKNVTPSASLADPIRIVQLGLTLQDVPLSEATFLGYPVADSTTVKGKVVPIYADADVLWAAIKNNAPTAVTGDLSLNNGVVDPSDAATDDAEAAPPTDDQATASPTADTVELPPSITGNTGEQATCSNGSG